MTPAWLRTRALEAAASLAVLAVLTGVALAGPPAEDAYRETGLDAERLGKNADKDGERFWKVVHGARFGEKTVRPGSPAPFEVDFYDVAFRDQGSGFAVGARCRDPLDPADPDFEREARGCERVPVVYRYTETQGWEEAYRASGRGYAGAAAFIDHDTALIVGGSGEFPRRERNPVGPEWSFDQRAQHDREHGSGLARAWIWDRGETRELTDLPAGMRGLNALDMWIGSDEPGEEFGVAGGLGELWVWRGDRFDERFDRNTPAPYARDAQLFTSRVREIRIAPDRDHPHVFAATAGCCGERAADGTPTGDPGSRRIEYLDVSEGTTGGYGSPKAASEPRWTVSGADGDSTYSFGILGTQVTDFAKFYGFRWTFGAPAKAAGGPPSDAETSFRSVAADGDTEPARGQPGHPSPPDGDGNLDWRVGELRSADRGLGGQALIETTREVRPDPNDAVGPDCARSPWEGRPEFNDFAADQTNDEVLLYDEKRNSILNAGPPPRVCRVEQLGAGQVPTNADEETLRESQVSRVWSLPAYRLNALELLDDAGDGWAVGDRGAIARYGDDAAAGGAEPGPPLLGERGEGALPDGEPYAALGRGSAAEPGLVPRFLDMPPDRSRGEAFVSEGSPDATEAASRAPAENVHTIVMSRDGEEGWAIGPSPEASVGSSAAAIATLHHYEEGRWTRCEGAGVPGVEPRDAACAPVAGLLRAGSPTVRLMAAARVPLENDDDPSNDDEFEVLALGSHYAAAGDPPGPQGSSTVPLVARYRDGEWKVESHEMRSSLFYGANGVDTSSLVGFKALALSAPDEGWALSGRNRLFRFDGKRFINCYTVAVDRLANQEACGDPENRLPGLGLGVNQATLTAVGDRVYLGGTRAADTLSIDVSRRGAPVLLYKDRSEERWHDELAGEATPQTGTVSAFAMSRREDGEYEGWAFGSFGGLSGVQVLGTAVDVPEASILRLEPGRGWRPYAGMDAAADYLRPISLDSALDYGNTNFDTPAYVNSGRAAIAPGNGESAGRVLLSRLHLPGLLQHRPERGRFEVVDSGRLRLGSDNHVQALAPDERGGFWVAVGSRQTPSGGQSDVFFYRLTPNPRQEVFESSPHPAQTRRITALEGAGDGSLWMGTDSDALYRYDRVTGWDRIRVPGWERGRLVTRPSAVSDVALAPSGDGIAVGERGRIVRLTRRGARLDEAAGRSCETEAQGACGTGRHLRAAAVSADGSALATGDARTILWSPAGEPFRRAAPPPTAKDARLVAASMPLPGRAWVVTDTGQLFAGREDGGSWRWVREAVDAGGRPLTVGRARGTDGAPARGPALKLADVAIRPDSTGYLVGDGGLVMERTAGGEWRRVDTERTDDLTSVALPVGGGPGALVGGRHGLVLTLVDGRFDAARPADFLRSPGGSVTDLVVTPGLEGGQVEAWGVVTPPSSDARSGNSDLLHFAGDPDEPLLNPGERADAIPDTAGRRPGELAVAAFGRSECHLSDTGGQTFCNEFFGGNYPEETVLRRVRDEIGARAERSDTPFIALHTGDTSDSGGATGRAATDGIPGSSATTAPGFDIRRRGIYKFHRLGEGVFDALGRRGVGVFGAIGGRDLSETKNCSAYYAGIPACVNTKTVNGAPGENLAWRQGFAGRPGGWGSREPLEAGELRFTPAAPDSPTYVRDHPGGRVGGARTHYAVDARDEEGRRVARIVVVDTSLRSLAASDGTQQPAEEQLTWLESALCTSGTGCTRTPDQPAIVVSNTPTYSYGPGIGTDTQSDAAAFEAVLIRHRASLVVSGRLGWNGRYWANAPGVHEPCPGGAYVPDEHAPAAGSARACGREVAAGPAETARNAAEERTAGAARALANALDESGLPAAPEVERARRTAEDVTGATSLTAALPFVVAASAGGRFGPDGSGSGSAAQGFWRGYSVARVPRSGSGATIVEQRPVLDWVRIEAQEHVMRAGQRMTLRGEGREPVGAVWSNGRFIRFESAATNHRYDLWEADDERPWLPKRDADGAYVPLAPDIATVDRRSGRVAAGRGNRPRAYAVATLSVGCSGLDAGAEGRCDRGLEGVHTASYPLVFEPRKSFAALAPARVASPRPPAQVPPIRTLAATPSVPPQQPGTPPPPVNASPTFPPTPALPAPPPPLGGTTPGPPAPPTPPPPPPPQLPTALDLLAAPPSVPLAPQATVIPPPAPPIQPAPPGGARREARQRQAAVQKGEEGGGQDASEIQDAGGDSAENRPGVNASTRAEATVRVRGEQPSAWTRTALYGGGTALAALVLALGWTGVRPLPRRQEPRGAAAWARRR